MRKQEMVRRQRWLAEFERRVVERSPAHAGKINWDAATHLFNKGVPVHEAAERFVASEQPMERRMFVIAIRNYGADEVGGVVGPFANAVLAQDWINTWGTGLMPDGEPAAWYDVHELVAPGGL